MQKATLKVTTPSDLEVVMTRELNAPRTMVWDAMTKPELIKRWLFLPPGWEMVSCEEDLRVGGKFRWVWNGPDGQKAMEMSGVYREVVVPERAVRTETFIMGCDSRLGEQIATLTLKEQAGRTTVTMHVLFPTKEARDGMVCSGMEHGVAAGYDKMEELLAELAAK